MNQILVTNYEDYIYNDFEIQYNKSKKKYLNIFLISIFLCFIILCYLLFSALSKLKELEKTKILKSKYNITTLYSSNDNYDTLKLSDTISIIGLLEIPNINISYPILSNSSDELLKFSVCRFSGPLPNRIGNLCIAGHNYKNNIMFSNLHKLNIGDSIYITDLNNTKMEYIIYDTLKVKENNLECIKETLDSQITLITCNQNNNTERIVVKAKMKV